MSDAQAPSGAPGTSATTAAASAAADPSKAGTAPTPTAGKEEISSFTTISSMEDLKKKSPELYKKMMEGIANTIVNRMRRQQEHLKKVWRENRERAGIQT